MRLDLRPPRRRRPVLNVTSLIDVLFLLLIFFMVSSTFVEHPAIQLELPHAATAEPTKVDSATLLIAADGSMTLDGDKVGLDGLAERLRRTVEASPDVALVLEADRRVGYGAVIAAIDRARAAGVKRLNAFTAGEGPAGSPPGP